MEKISFFSADFRDGRIRIGYKTYPSGTFATHLLNQYYNNDTAMRISVYVANNWAVQSSLTKGYLNSRLLEEAGKDILNILVTLPKLKPFDMFDIDSERHLISETFTEENGNFLVEYFQRKSAVMIMDDSAIIHDLPPEEYDKELFSAADNLLSLIWQKLHFYDDISSQMREAFEGLTEFCKRLDEAERFDEPQMNSIAKGYRKKYGMNEHFADIKQALAVGLCKALVKYDISKSPFLPYADRYMEREAHNYIRTMRTGYSIQSEYEYARLRKAMKIYMDLGGEFTEELITKVAERIGESYEKTKSIIESGILTENYIDVQNSDEDDEKTTDFLLPDFTLNPEDVYFKQELYDKLYEAYDSLEYTEKIMLSQHFGFCPECFSVHYADINDLDENNKPKEKPIKPLPYTDITTDHGFSDADTAKKVCEKAMKKLLYNINTP